MGSVDLYEMCLIHHSVILHAARGGLLLFELFAHLEKTYARIFQLGCTQRCHQGEKDQMTVNNHMEYREFRWNCGSSTINSERGTSLTILLVTTAQHYKRRSARHDHVWLVELVGWLVGWLVD